MIANIRWDVDDKCNLSCKHCLVGKIKYPKSVELKKGLSIIDKLKKQDVREICFSTKEPFMNKNILDYIKYCTMNGIYSSIITNSTLLDKSIIKQLSQLKIKYLGISMEGWTKESNDFIRGVGTFDIIKEKLDMIYKHNCECQPEFILDVVVQLNLTTRNYYDVDEFIDFFSNYKNFKICIGEIISLGNANDNVEIIPKENCYINFIDKLTRKVQNLENFENEIHFTNLSYFQTVVLNALSLISNNPEVYNCPINKGSFSILPNGDICRCSYLMDKDESKLNFKLSGLGNLLDNNCMLKFEKISNYENMHYKENLLCKSCKFNDKCNLCYAQQFEQNNEIIISNCKNGRYMYNNLIRKIIKNKVYLIFPKRLITILQMGSLYMVNRQYKGIVKKYEINESQFKFLIDLKEKKKCFADLHKINLLELEDILEKGLILIEGVSLNDLLSND